MRATRGIRVSTGLLGLLAGLWALLVVGASLAQQAETLLTSQATVGGNAFTTAACFAGNTGLLNPSANSADTGGNGNGYETNPTNAYADGGGNATDAASNGDRHRYFNYGISIPAGCSIKGIEVRLDWWLGSTAGINSMSVALSWNGGTSWTAAKTDATETTVQHTTTLGSSVDTWSHSWATSEVTNGNFRVRLTDNTDGNGTFNLDWIPVEVYYGP